MTRADTRPPPARPLRLLSAALGLALVPAVLAGAPGAAAAAPAPAAVASAEPGAGGLRLAPAPALVPVTEAEEPVRTLVPELPPPTTPDGRPAARSSVSTWQVTYTGFPAEARAAFQRAVDRWAQLVPSDVPIRVSASYEPLGGAGLLAQAGPTEVGEDAGTLYPVATAEAKYGRELNGGRPDIVAEFNSGVRWYFGTGAPSSTQVDFSTVVLHELGHGLGLVGSAQVAGGVGTYGESGRPLVFDRFTAAMSGPKAVLDMPNGSSELTRALQSGTLGWIGAYGRAAGRGVPVLYAPPTWEDGSSYSHLDEATYRAGDPDSLMTPQVARGEVIRSPGRIALGMLADMGFDLAPLPALAAGQELAAGQRLVSSDGSHRLVVQEDGNVVVYRNDGTPVWATGTSTPGSRLLMQSDGDLLLLRPDGTVAFRAGSRTAGSRFALGDDGNAVVYRPDGSAAFASARTSLLLPGDRLGAGASVWSPLRSSRLVVQADGNVVVYGPGGPVRWYSGTSTPGTALALQADGNLVAYAPDGRPVFWTGTSGTARAAVQDDGNLVLYAPSGAVLFASATDARSTAVRGATLSAGQSRGPGEQVTSPDGRVRLLVQSDGNLVLYAGARAAWASRTSAPGSRLTMQGDGNLVLVGPNGVPTFSTRTGGSAGARALVQDDANLVVYRADGSPAYASAAG